MYHVIVANLNQLLAPDPAFSRAIADYKKLIRDVRAVEVTMSLDFKNRYRRFWQMNQARLSDGFFEAYFCLLEQLKTRHDAQISDIAQRLYSVATHGNGRHSLQFSFASKLLHTVDPHSPIYDSAVEAFYFLPKIKPSDSCDKNLLRLLHNYGFITAEVRRVLANNLLRTAIDRFREHYDEENSITDEKIVDTLIWRFVTFAWSGALRDIRVRYC